MFSYSSWHTTPNQFDRKNLKVARKATVPVLLYCILAIVTEHLADADSLFRQQKEPVYTKYHHINSPKAEPSGSLPHKVPKGVVS